MTIEANGCAGHAEAVLSVQLSPDGKRCASGSGDTTVRFWDVMTNTPQFTGQGMGMRPPARPAGDCWHGAVSIDVAYSYAPAFSVHDTLLAACRCRGRQRIYCFGTNANLQCWSRTGHLLYVKLAAHRNNSPAAHKNWVLCIAWSPDGARVASGGMDNDVYLWDPRTGGTVGKPLKGHKKWVTCISWEPYHLYVIAVAVTIDCCGRYPCLLVPRASMVMTHGDGGCRRYAVTAVHRLADVPGLVRGTQALLLP
jgi:WD40 repeat protein